MLNNHRLTRFRPSLVRLSLALALILGISACANTRIPGVFKINVQQGNIVTDDMLSKLEPGMNQEQIEYLLGSPVLVDPYHPERWNYAYTLKLGKAINGEKYREQFIVVMFDEQGLYKGYEGALYQEKLSDPQQDRQLEQRVKNRKREIKKAD